ncbi:MAG TPA: hypothetical protein VLE23_12750, partial [Geminicoccaceae bacterium]|nr:hypothetical protein [Geminicoccaceae bacterium]
ASALGVAAGGGAAAGRRVLEGSEHGSVSGVARWEKGAGSSRLRVRSGVVLSRAVVVGWP